MSAKTRSMSPLTLVISLGLVGSRSRVADAGGETRDGRRQSQRHEYFIECFFMFFFS